MFSAFHRRSKGKTTSPMPEQSPAEESLPWDRIIPLLEADLNATLHHPPHRLFERTTNAARLVFVETRHGPGTPARFVIKLPRRKSGPSAWNPQREFDGLRRLSACPKTAAWSVTRPIGFGLDPPFLITQFMQAEPLRRRIESGMRRLARRADLAHSANTCELIGRLHADMRAVAEPADRDEIILESTMISSCEDRLIEMETFYRSARSRRIRANLNDWIERSVPPIWSECESQFALRYPTHGDLSFENVLCDADGRLCLVDLEGFKMTPVNVDYAKFRFRFEHQCLSPLFSRARVETCWSRFHQAAATGSHSSSYLVLSYLHTLLALLAWAAHPRNRRVGGNLRIRARSRMWIKQRMKWLQRIDRSTTFGTLWDMLVGEL